MIHQPRTEPGCTVRHPPGYSWADPGAGGVTIRPRGLTPDQVAEAARLYEEGCSSARIGERLGFNGQTIGTTLRKLGVRIRDPQG
nr:helix-turn-helix domain-containing protein [Streptomyces sp. SID13031]